VEDQPVMIAKSHENSQPNMNSVIRMTANVAEELNQLNEHSGIKKEGIQHIKAQLGMS
jgi:hypothetical protein